MGQLYSAFMDDTVVLLEPSQIAEYKQRLEKIPYLKDCCRGGNLRFLSWNPRAVHFRCAKCNKTIEYDFRFRSYSYL